MLELFGLVALKILWCILILIPFRAITQRVEVEG